MTQQSGDSDEWIDPPATTTAETDRPKPSDPNQQARWQHFVEKCGFPRLHIKAMQDPSFKAGWSAAASEWLYPMPENAMPVVLGPIGVGKTQSVTHMAAYHTVVHGWSSRYLTAPALFGRLRASFTNKSDPMQELTKVRLLVIDEVHVRQETRYEIVNFTELIDARYRELRATVMVSSLSEEAFRESVGEAVYSRVCEAGRVVRLSGPPRR